MNRRTFLGAAAAGAATFPVIGQTAVSGSKLRIGLIGAGWYGMVDVKAALRAGGVEIIAVCDVDRRHLEDSVAEIETLQGSRPRSFKHYEDLLQVPELEAVIIATPPHWHALQFITALEAGVDIYCEKPLSYDVREGRAMVEKAQAAGRVVQIGFQRRQSPAVRAVREFVQSGKAGRIVQVVAQIHYRAGMRDATPQEPPPELDWNLWCGPAPKLPYSPQVGHFSWRLEKAYGHGHLVDWGIHLIDATRWILGESTPRTVHAAGGIYYFKDHITTPDIMTANFEFATCPVHWRHRIWGAAEMHPELSNGIFLYGEDATLFVTDDKWTLVPRGAEGARQENQIAADLAKEHMADFLEAVRRRGQPACSIEDAYQSTATVQLAMAAYESGGPLTWDADTESISDNTAAAARLKRDYRQPYEHPYSG